MRIIDTLLSVVASLVITTSLWIVILQQNDPIQAWCIIVIIIAALCVGQKISEIIPSGRRTTESAAIISTAFTKGTVSLFFLHKTCFWLSIQFVSSAKVLLGFQNRDRSLLGNPFSKIFTDILAHWKRFLVASLIDKTVWKVQLMQQARTPTVVPS
jgi:hypothetical protein